MKRIILPHTLFTALLLMAIAVFMSISYPEIAASQEKPQYGGILRNAEGAGAPGSIGWPPSAVGNDALGMKPVIECLVRQDNMGEIHPWLATAWKIPPDQSSITFTLRKGLKFHDGSEFNAEVVRFCLQAYKDAKKDGSQNWTSLEVVDDYTFRINLNKYENTLLGRFSGNAGAIVSKEAVEKNGVDWAKLNPVGTGPFKFVSFQRDVVTKFKRNEDYWQKGKPYLDAVELHVIKDPMTQQAAMRAGEIEVLAVEWGKMAADMKAQGFNILTAPSGTISLLPDSVNADSFFADKRVVEAIEYAIDREAIVKAKGYGFFRVAYQFPPPATAAYDPSFKGRRYDPEKAKKLLADAGYPKGFKTKIIPMPFGIDRDIMVAIQSYLGAVGIEIELDFVPYSKYSEYRMKGWHNAMLCQPIGLFPNFNQTIQWYFAADSPQFPSLKRPDGFQEMLNESLVTTDLDKAKVRKVVKKMFDEAMIIPIHDTGRAYVHQKYVHDTEHMQWGSWTNWRPDNAWLSK